MARILIIDDDAAVRRYMRGVLTRSGHEVVEADGGDAGLAVLRAEPPDLVVCDLFMPGRDGIDTIRELRRTAPSIPVVAISGGGSYGLISMLKGAAMLGATLALPKPVGPDVLLQAVNGLLSIEQGATL